MQATQTISPALGSNGVAATYGPPQLCAWPVGPGECRFQTTDPEFARKLSKRRGAVLTAWGVNRFVRVFQEAMPLRQAKGIVNRYLKVIETSEVSPNSSFLSLQGRTARRKGAGGSLHQPLLTVDAKASYRGATGVLTRKAGVA